MNQYTVLLLRPDYMTDNFGQDTYQAWVTAPGVAQAKTLAQQEAHYQDSPEEVPLIDNPEDYFVLAVYSGHIHDLNPGECP